MKKYDICVIKGDGIGPEIIDEAVKVLDAISHKCGFELNFDYFLMGGAAIDVFGEPLPKNTLDAALKSDAVLFGAIGGEKWDKLPYNLWLHFLLLHAKADLSQEHSLYPPK